MEPHFRPLTIPLGPSVLLTKSPMAIAPTKALYTRMSHKVGGRNERLAALDSGPARMQYQTGILSTLLGSVGLQHRDGGCSLFPGQWLPKALPRPLSLPSPREFLQLFLFFSAPLDNDLEGGGEYICMERSPG